MTDDPKVCAVSLGMDALRICIEQLSDCLDIAQSTIYNQIHKGTFPAKIRPNLGALNCSFRQEE